MPSEPDRLETTGLVDIDYSFWTDSKLFAERQEEVLAVFDI